MCAMKVVPDVRWHFELEKIDDQTFFLDVALIERGLPLAGFGGDIRKDQIEALINQLTTALGTP